MTNFFPDYRNTFEKLDAEKKQAEAWFKNQIALVVDEMENFNWLTQEARERIEKGDYKVYTSVDRSGEYHSYSGKKSSSYYFVWRIREPGTYKDARFVLRKDNTIRLEKAVESVIYRVNADIQEEIQKDIFESNKKRFKELFKVDSLYDFTNSKTFSLELSRYDIDTMKIHWYDVGINVKKDIQFEDLDKFLSICESFKTDLEEMK